MKESSLLDAISLMAKEGVVKEYLDGVGFQKILDEFKYELKMPLRDYQLEALQNSMYAILKKGCHHLLYDMATGSGKTLLMAATMLALKKTKGIKRFIFIVNSLNIIGKTRLNFSSFGGKSLFTNKIVLRECSQGFSSHTDTIEIMFTTVQKLAVDLTDAREGALSIADLSKQQFAILADEAHHLSSDTKSRGATSVNSWENVIGRLLAGGKNLLLEFTATAELHLPQVRAKYLDKHVFDYTFPQFYRDGYSKDIKSVKLDLGTPNEMILTGCLASIARKRIAESEGISNFKPAILVKSTGKIQDLEDIHSNFKSFASSLTERYLSKFISGLRDDFCQFGPLIKRLTTSNLTTTINELRRYAETSVIIHSKMKSKDVGAQEVMKAINSLEDNGNPIHLVFAIDMLNEGWDVQNLYDIVKVDKPNTSAKIITKEVQLIGRGARIYPYQDSDPLVDRFKRRCDSNHGSAKKMLEQLHFYTQNNSAYLSKLQAELKKNGMSGVAGTDQRPVRLKDAFRKKVSPWSATKIHLNQRIEKPRAVNLRECLGNLSVHKVSFGSFEADLIRDKIGDTKGGEIVESFLIKDQSVAVLATLNSDSRFNFSYLQGKFVNLKSKLEFVISDDYLGNYTISIEHNSRDAADVKRYRLAAIVDFARIVFKKMEGMSLATGTTEFLPRCQIMDVEDKIITTRPNSYAVKGETLAQEEIYASSEEAAFLDFLNRYQRERGIKDSEILVLRNEQHFPIYNFEDGQRTFPDFLVFVARDGITLQFFCEPKGEGFVEKDAWKQKLLLKIEYQTEDYVIYGLPFYTERLSEPEVKKDLDEKLKRPLRRKK